jgi:predicted NUDIX family NTP pyrophosphohydrolase
MSREFRVIKSGDDYWLVEDTEEDSLVRGRYDSRDDAVQAALDEIEECDLELTCIDPHNHEVEP